MASSTSAGSTSANQPRMTVHERPNRYAWVLGLMGLSSIVFGVLCLVWPGLTLEALVALFGAFVALSGVLSLAYTVTAIRDHESWWPALLIGVVDIAASVAVFTYPTLTAVTLVYVLAFWAIFTGMLEIGASLVTARFLWLVAGVLSLIVGFILLANPVAGALALVLVIGFFAVVWGIIFVIDAIRMPKVKEIQVL